MSNVRRSEQEMAEERCSKCGRTDQNFLVGFNTWSGYDTSELIYIDRDTVAWVRETTSRRAYGGNEQTAMIRLKDGSTVTVIDYGRNAAKKLGGNR
jgi:hypothetical protein